MFVYLFFFQFPEVILAEMSTSRSIPTSIYDCADNSRANNAFTNVVDHRMPLSPTLPCVKSECNDRILSSQGSVCLPVECSTLPSDGKDLLVRLLNYRPEHRIRSIFGIKRIAFFMGFNFDDVEKKKVTRFSHVIFSWISCIF